MCITKLVNQNLYLYGSNYYRVMGGDEPDNKKVKGSQDIQGMSSKQYLDTQVVPHLLPALNAVSTNRPTDPIQYLVC